MTIDLRDTRDRLLARAAQQNMTVAALVRAAVVEFLSGNDATPSPVAKPGGDDSGMPSVKVTLRMPQPHAMRLASEARAADVAQGIYVARLMDGTPVAPTPPDLGQAITALIASTDQMAAMAADLDAYTRLLRHGAVREAEKYCAEFASLNDGVRRHLALASSLLADVRARRPPRRNKRVNRRAQ